MNEHEALSDLIEIASLLDHRLDLLREDSESDHQALFSAFHEDFKQKIAAARAATDSPDLLDACKALVAAIPDTADLRQESAWQDAVSAIAKAEEQ